MKKDRGPAWIVGTGLTRRLVFAPNADDARTLFMYEAPLRVTLKLAERDVLVREATREEAAEFDRVPKSKLGAGLDQLSLTL